MLRLYLIAVRWRAQLASQDGMALIVALGTMLVLGVSGTALLYYSSANTRSASYSKASGTSFQLAEAGLHEALAVLSNQPTNDPTDADLLPPPASPRTSTYSTGTVTWSGVYDCAIVQPCQAKWTIKSTGHVANPAGVPPSEATRTITANVPIRPVTSQTLAADSWNYIFSYGTGDPSGCDMTLTSSVVIKTRLLASGNLCLTSSSQLAGPSTEVLVGGQTKIFGHSASIGNFGSDPVARLDSTNGCRLESSGVVQHNPCQGPPANADHVWASTITSSPALEPAPTPDWTRWYDRSSPGPTETCTGANRVGTPPTFDVDTVRNRNAPAANLTPAASYVCKTYLGGEQLGELSWNNSTKTLTVLGTIFIDGNAQVTQAGSYTGRATLYLSGSFYMGGSAKMCAVVVGGAGSDCNWTTESGAWDPNSRLLAIVTNGAGGFSGSVAADTTVNIDSSAMWQGAIYGGPYKARVQSSARFAGPIIADEVILSSSVQSAPFGIIGTSPTGLPGNSTIHARPDKLELFSG